MNIKIDPLKVATWLKVKPSEIKGDKLTSAIKTAEKAKGQEKQKGLSAIAEALQGVAAAAQEAIKKECDTKKHKDLVKALKKLSDDAEADAKKLGEQAQADDDDDEGEVSDAELFCPKMFKECLKKARLKKGTEDGVSFCLAMHKTAEESKLVLLKKKKFATQCFKQVLKVTKKDPSMGLKRPKMTYGAAYRVDDKLVLHIVDGAPTEIPGLVRKLEKWRKRFKQELLPFKDLEIRTPSGKPLEMTPDPDEEEEIATSGQGAEQENEAAPQEVRPNEGQGETQEVRPNEGQGETQEVRPNENQGETQEVRPNEGQGETQQAPATGPEADGWFMDRRKEFRKARRAWQTVKERAIQDLEAVKDGIRDYYLDDPEQFKIATGKLNQLDAIMDNLNDDLRDVLDKYVSTPQTRKQELQQLESQATTVVQDFLKYASNDKLLNAVDQKEFADVTVKAPIEKALKDLVKTLS